MKEKLRNICHDRSLCQDANQVFYEYLLHILSTWYIFLLRVLKILINVFNSIQFNLFCSSDPEGGCNPQDIEHVNYI